MKVRIIGKRATHGQPRIVCTYEQVLEQWKDVTTRIAGELEVPLRVGSDAQDAVNAFLEPRLRHYRDAR